MLYIVLWLLDGVSGTVTTLALNGIQQYIARDANIIGQVEEFIIVSSEKESSNSIIIIIYIGLCVSSYDRD